jgi:hypothetical protein
MKIVLPLFLIFSIGLLYSGILVGQSKSTSITIHKDEVPQSAYAVDGAGVLFLHKASMEEAKQVDARGRYPGAKIYRVNTQGQKVWEVLTGPQAYQGLLEETSTMGKMIFSSNLEVVYFVSGTQQKLDITQINARGESKKLEVENLFGYNFPHAMFCTKNEFAVVIRRNEPAKKGIPAKKIYFLHAWDNENMTKREVTLELPLIEKNGAYSDWSYYGNSDNEMYFVSHYTPGLIHDTKVRILKVDFKGKAQADFMLDLTINKNLGMYSVTNPRMLQGAEYFDTNISQSDMASLLIDPKNNAIYTWGVGLWTDQKKRNEGFYLNKYDLNGQLEWTTQEEIPESFVKNGLVKSVYALHSFSVLQVNFDQTLRLHFLVTGSIYTLEFFPHGDLRGSFFNKDVGIPSIGDASFNFIDREESPAFNFLRKKYEAEAKNKDFAKGSFHFFRFSDGELLAEFPKISDRFDLHWFKRE